MLDQKKKVYICICIYSKWNKVLGLLHLRPKVLIVGPGYNQPNQGFVLIFIVFSGSFHSHSNSQIFTPKSQPVCSSLSSLFLLVIIFLVLGLFYFPVSNIYVCIYIYICIVYIYLKLSSVLINLVQVHKNRNFNFLHFSQVSNSSLIIGEKERKEKERKCLGPEL